MHSMDLSVMLIRMSLKRSALKGSDLDELSYGIVKIPILINALLFNLGRSEVF